MFTGIVQAIGQVAALQHINDDIRLTINVNDLDMQDVALGDSIAVNGVCLTAVEFSSSQFSADVSQETISLTSLTQLKVGSPVNLEKALTLASRLGGHLVSGHVDTTATIGKISTQARSIQYALQLDKNYHRYTAVKGSITVDGVSLTINRIENDALLLNIVPHTQQMTVFQHYQTGSVVNIEVDIIARYLEQLLKPELAEHNAVPHSNITAELLNKQGFKDA